MLIQNLFHLRNKEHFEIEVWRKLNDVNIVILRTENQCTAYDNKWWIPSNQLDEAVKRKGGRSHLWKEFYDGTSHHFFIALSACRTLGKRHQYAPRFIDPTLNTQQFVDGIHVNFMYLTAIHAYTNGVWELDRFVFFGSACTVFVI